MQVIKPPSEHVSAWDKYAVRNWLLSEGFPDEGFTSVLLEHGIDGPRLQRLHLDNMRDMGVDVGLGARLVQRKSHLSVDPDVLEEEETCPHQVIFRW